MNTNQEQMFEALDAAVDAIKDPGEGKVVMAHFTLGLAMSSTLVEKADKEGGISLGEIVEDVKFLGGNSGNESLNEILLKQIIGMIFDQNPEIYAEVRDAILQKEQSEATDAVKH